MHCFRKQPPTWPCIMMCECITDAATGQCMLTPVFEARATGFYATVSYTKFFFRVYLSCILSPSQMLYSGTNPIHPRRPPFNHYLYPSTFVSRKMKPYETGWQIAYPHQAYCNLQLFNLFFGGTVHIKKQKHARGWEDTKKHVHPPKNRDCANCANVLRTRFVYSVPAPHIATRGMNSTPLFIIFTQASSPLH